MFESVNSVSRAVSLLLLSMFLLSSSLAPERRAQLSDQPARHSQHRCGKHGCFTCSHAADTVRDVLASQWPQLPLHQGSSHTPPLDACSVQPGLPGWEPSTCFLDSQQATSQAFSGNDLNAEWP